MFRESQILLDILKELLERQVVALPIHDALIVEADKATLVTEVMLRVFKLHTGVAALVDTDDGD